LLQHDSLLLLLLGLPLLWAHQQQHNSAQVKQQEWC
jgi:hypothetical protein